MFARTTFLEKSVLVALFAVLLYTFTVTAAHAHDQIIDQFPATNENLTSSPETIVLEFNNKPLDMGTVVRVTDATGNDLTIGEPVIAGFSVNQTVEADLPDGYYRVQWRVVSSDGHPISESFLFSVGEVTEDMQKPGIGAGNAEHNETDKHVDSSETKTDTPPGQNPGDKETAQHDSTAEDMLVQWQSPIFMVTGAVLALAIFGLARAAQKPKTRTVLPKNDKGK